MKICARIIIGYFTYASAIMEMTIPLTELREISKREYCGKVVIFPSNKYDIWGLRIRKRLL